MKHLNDMTDEEIYKYMRSNTIVEYSFVDQNKKARAYKLMNSERCNGSKEAMNRSLRWLVEGK